MIDVAWLYHHCSTLCGWKSTQDVMQVVQDTACMTVYFASAVHRRCVHYTLCRVDAYQWYSHVCSMRLGVLASSVCMFPDKAASTSAQPKAANVHVSVWTTCTGRLNKIGENRAEYLQSQVEDHCCLLEAACGCLMSSGSDPSRYCSACFCHTSSHPLLDTSRTLRSASKLCL